MDLAAAVLEGFGIPRIGVQPTGLGADARASLWRGVTADDTSYAVKTSSAPQPGLAVADFLGFAEDALSGDHSVAQRADALRIAAGALGHEGIVALTLSEGAAGH